MHEFETIITTDHHLPFRILGVIGAAFVIAFVFEAGPAVVFAVLVMGCIAAAMESIAGSNKNRRTSVRLQGVAPVRAVRTAAAEIPRVLPSRQRRHKLIHD